MFIITKIIIILTEFQLAFKESKRKSKFETLLRSN